MFQRLQVVLASSVSEHQMLAQVVSRVLLWKKPTCTRWQLKYILKDRQFHIRYARSDSQIFARESDWRRPRASWLSQCEHCCSDQGSCAPTAVFRLSCAFVNYVIACYSAIHEPRRGRIHTPCRALMDPVGRAVVVYLQLETWRHVHIRICAPDGGLHAKATELPLF